MTGNNTCLQLTQKTTSYETEQQKRKCLNGKNVLRTVALASSCLAVAAMLVPATPVIGGIGLVCSKTIPSWLRGHAFF